MNKAETKENPESDIEDYSYDDGEYKSEDNLDEPQDKTAGETSIVKQKKKKGFEALNLDENLLKAIKILPKRSLRSSRSLAKQKMAITSDATVMSNFESRS